MVFHEITREAIARRDRQLARPRHEARRGAGGPAHPRPPRRLGGLDRRVPAHRPRARRPGRVQSVADADGRRPRARAHGVPLRLATGTSRARSPRQPTPSSRSRRTLVAARRPAPRVGRDFDPTPASSPPTPNVVLLDEAGRGRARRPPRRRRRSPSRRSSPARSPRRPKAPFITSTLQQEAGRKLGFSAGRTMSVAQGLYERGLHHLHADRQHEPVGAGGHRRPPADPPACTATTTCPPQPRAYRSKVKNAQEAHEAIRPAGDAHPHRRRRRAASCRQRRAPPLRADLEAHRRVPDGRRPHPARHRSGSARRRPPARTSMFQATRPHHRVPRLPRAPTSKAPTTPTPSSRTARPCCRRSPKATPCACAELAPVGPHDAAAGALHRGEPR